MPCCTFTYCCPYQSLLQRAGCPGVGLSPGRHNTAAFSGVASPAMLCPGGVHSCALCCGTRSCLTHSGHCAGCHSVLPGSTHGCPCSSRDPQVSSDCVHCNKTVAKSDQTAASLRVRGRHTCLGPARLMTALNWNARVASLCVALAIMRAPHG